MFFKKKKQLRVSEIIAASKFPADLHHRLAMRSITIAISSSETTSNVKCDSNKPHLQLIDIETRFIGVVHFHHFRDMLVPVLLYTSSTIVDGDIGFLTVYREQGEASVKTKYEEYGDRIDPVYAVDIWLLGDGSKLRDLIQVGLENCVKDGKRFLHLEFSLPTCDPDKAVAELESSSRLKLRIKALTIVDELTLPRAPVWSHRWWYK